MRLAELTQGTISAVVRSKKKKQLTKNPFCNEKCRSFPKKSAKF